MQKTVSVSSSESSVTLQPCRLQVLKSTLGAGSLRPTLQHAGVRACCSYPCRRETRCSAMASAPHSKKDPHLKPGSGGSRRQGFWVTSFQERVGEVTET